MSDVLWLLPLGLFAGGLTTLAGLGGGLILTLALAAAWGPAPALATAAPALLVGNVHRVALYRRHADWRGIAPFLLGGVPGALLGGVLTVNLPETVLRALLLGAVGLAFARELRLLPRGLGGANPKPPPDALVVGGMFVAGVVTATSGGGGLLLAPLLLMRGFTNERFVVAASSVATGIHVARIAGYGAGGLVTADVLANAGVLAVAILLGNVLGRRGRRWMSERAGVALTYGVLATSALLTVLGLR
ncbi:MAG: TSUP family transporter [Myxococcota bacterium]